MAVTAQGGAETSSQEKARGLTREGLEALLAYLDPDREVAGEQYVSIRRRLIRLFEWRGCDVAEDLADETINRVARRLAEGVLPANPFGYFCGVAHMVHKEFLRKGARERAALESGDWHPLPEPDDEPDPRVERVRHCLESLPEDQRQLVLQYHQGENNIQTRKELSEKLSVPMNALRIRVHRIRKKIEECVGEHLRG
jgi:RNA polymerase sigma factor (sigma-70 family)